MIDCFRDNYYFLSNFYMCDVEWEHIKYPSSEHAFQAAKTLDTEMRNQIALIPTPGLAKSAGQGLELRSDWDQVKILIMYEIVLLKFTQNPPLGELLVQTDHARLIEGNTWGDRFWGCEKLKGEWIGENWLGIILMRIRESLQ